MKEYFRKGLKPYRNKKKNEIKFVSIFNGRTAQKDFLFGLKFTKKKEKQSLVFSLHTIPASFNVEQAKGICLRPHLNEFNIFNKYGSKIEKKMDSKVFPIPIIICLRNITKAQVRKYYGSENVILVNTEFGIYMLDESRHVQLVFLKNCNNINIIEEHIKGLVTWFGDEKKWEIFSFERCSQEKYKTV